MPASGAGLEGRPRPGPASAGVCETVCIAYIVVLLSCLVAITVVCARNRAFRWDSLRWQDLTHDIRGYGPAKLAMMRLGMAAYALITCLVPAFGPIERDKDGHIAAAGPALFSTFTIWCWLLLGLYMLLAGTASAFAAWVRPASADAKGSCIGCFLWVYFEVMFSCALLVCLVTWFVLVPQSIVGGYAHVYFNFFALSAHNLNVAFMAVELLVNRLVFVPAHGVFMLYYGCAYIVFSWFWFLASGKFNYNFIDWRSFMTPVWYTALIAAQWSFFRGGHQMSERIKRSVAIRTQLQLPGHDNFPDAPEVGQVLTPFETTTS